MSSFSLAPLGQTDVLMTVDPKVSRLPAVSFQSHSLLPFPQAIQHVFHKSGYNYTKKTSQNFLAYLMAGPGIATMLGKMLCPTEC